MSPESHQALEDKLRGVIVEQLGVDEEEVTNETSLVKELGADSLDMVEVVMALEDTFQLEVPEEDIADIETFGDLVAYMAGRVPDYTAA